jgi:hypothetical protein
MRRSLAFVVLALLVGTPLLQLRCAMACASDGKAESGACHHRHATASGVAISESHHDCSRHATPVAVRSTDRLLTPDALPVASTAPATSAGDVDFASRAFVIASPGGPPGTFVVPLRV